jgi:hypothetical protein
LTGTARKIAIVAALGGCAHAEPPTGPAAQASATELTALSPAAPTPARIRARVTMGEHSWLDIAVDQTTDASRRTCDVLVRRESRNIVVPSQPAVTRACEPAPLPAPPRTAGAIVLVRKVPIDHAALELDVVLMGGPIADPWEPATTGTISYVTRFRSRAECERRRSTLEQAMQHADAETAAVQRKFLDDEAALAAERQSRRCDEAHATAERCKTIGPGADAFKAECRDGRSKRCRDATEKAMRRVTCDAVQEADERRCAEATTQANTIRDQASEVAAHPPPPRDPGTCRPEW